MCDINKSDLTWDLNLKCFFSPHAMPVYTCSLSPVTAAATLLIRLFRLHQSSVKHRLDAVPSAAQLYFSVFEHSLFKFLKSSSRSAFLGSIYQNPQQHLFSILMRLKPFAKNRKQLWIQASNSDQTCPKHSNVSAAPTLCLKNNSFCQKVLHLVVTHGTAICSW